VNFANGSQSAKIEILGDGAAPAASSTLAMWPSGVTKATVVNGGASFDASSASPAVKYPSYTFTMAKGSAYSRPWRFSP
jgi:hypothetical protein